MFNNNVLEMAGMVPVGTSVRIINDAYKFGASGGKVYLEAHTPLNDDGTPSVVDKHTAVINALLKREDLSNQLRVNWDTGAGCGGGRRWFADGNRRAGPGTDRLQRADRPAAIRRSFKSPSRPCASAGFLLCVIQV